MINTAYSTLYKAPEALNGIGMGIPNHILARRMIALDMVKSSIFNFVIDRILVRINDSFPFNILGDKGHNSGTLDIGNRFNANLPLALCYTDHRNLMRTYGWPTLIVTTPFATHVSLVNFNLIREHTIAFIKKRSN